MKCFKPIWPLVWRSTYEEALDTIEFLEGELLLARKNDHRDSSGKFTKAP